jgi:hypothetical protein
MSREDESIDRDQPADAGPESTLDEFVDYLNARDLDGIAELLHPEVTFDTAGGSGSQAVADSLGELVLRNPGVVFTRGELGTEPVVVAWSPAGDHDYAPMGSFSFTFLDEDGEALVEHIGYDDGPPDEDRLLAEEPDPADMPEGMDWEEWDSGES